MDYLFVRYSLLFKLLALILMLTCFDPLFKCRASSQARYPLSDLDLKSTDLSYAPQSFGFISSAYFFHEASGKLIVTAGEFDDTVWSTELLATPLTLTLKATDQLVSLYEGDQLIASHHYPKPDMYMTLDSNGNGTLTDSVGKIIWRGHAELHKTNDGFYTPKGYESIIGGGNGQFSTELLKHSGTNNKHEMLIDSAGKTIWEADVNKRLGLSIRIGNDPPYLMDMEGQDMPTDSVAEMSFSTSPGWLIVRNSKDKIISTESIQRLTVKNSITAGPYSNEYSQIPISYHSPEVDVPETVVGNLKVIELNSNHTIIGGEKITCECQGIYPMKNGLVVFSQFVKRTLLSSDLKPSPFGGGGMGYTTDVPASVLRSKYKLELYLPSGQIRP